MFTCPTHFRAPTCRGFASVYQAGADCRSQPTAKRAGPSGSAGEDPGTNGSGAVIRDKCRVLGCIRWDVHVSPAKQEEQCPCASKKQAKTSADVAHISKSPSILNLPCQWQAPSPGCQPGNTHEQAARRASGLPPEPAAPLAREAVRGI
eukprot:CAMPEP_0117680574 /NCGR_PEP_ID=MMETSP0804-20121206/18435_1 /TAXON_ID=1074897 /ORGANISM="Tetraselmis astigmatica, Strain CCMP880" /LENGTH=148 /DNA_ID=CAMNT_0005490101 /DNA_START=553 /DNA_END=996 /DNA_ORIENTATION=+